MTAHHSVALHAFWPSTWRGEPDLLRAMVDTFAAR